LQSASLTPAKISLKNVSADKQLEHDSVLSPDKDQEMFLKPRKSRLKK